MVLDYARRFDNLREAMDTALRELKDNSAGRLVVGANESTALYLLPHVSAYRRLYPRVAVEVRRSLSSKVPAQLADGDLELGVISYDPRDPRLSSTVIYRDHLAFIVSPRHRLASRRSVSIRDLGMENFVAHNVVSPYRDLVLRAFQRYRVPLHMDVEMPTVETIRKLVQANEGVAFLPRMCVEPEIERRVLCEVAVRELKLTRQVRLAYPARRPLSHAARAFLDLVRQPR
ncbi:MAG: transcriptional regulator, LysR family [Acidobacteria bacterium]|nr:transcriptional regulator, LysR family [Acidobacteriota bacterium]